jgi:hypothetical protein
VVGEPQATEVVTAVITSGELEAEGIIDFRFNNWGYGFPTGRASLRIERNASGEQEGRLGDEGLHGFAFHVG